MNKGPTTHKLDKMLAELKEQMAHDASHRGENKFMSRIKHYDFVVDMISYGATFDLDEINMNGSIVPMGALIERKEKFEQLLLTDGIEDCYARVNLEAVVNQKKTLHAMDIFDRVMIGFGIFFCSVFVISMVISK